MPNINSAEDVTEDILDQLGDDFANDEATETINQGDTSNEQNAESSEESQEDITDPFQDTEAPANNAEANDKSNGEQGTKEEGQDQSNRGPQDLVDGAGNIIAKGGKERRFYETAQRERMRADQVTKEFNEAKIKLEAYEKAVTIGSQLNLTPQEVTAGAQIMSSWKNDPIGTLKQMLTQAQSAGYNIEELQGNDMAAIQKMIADAVSPLTSKVQEEQQASVYKQEAEKQYNQFISIFPDARVHEESIARLLSEQPNLSLEAAYYKLQAFYAQRGLDWTKNLTTLELEAKQKEAANQVSNVEKETLPSGKGSVNANPLSEASTIADPNESFDDIIRATLKEAGIN